MASIQGIYIALFGRPADPLGLEYFNGVTGNGADLAAISDLAATAEYQDRFEGMSNVQIINSIYQSLFGRDADLAGLTFFAQALQDGTFNINNIAIAILDGAQGDDLVTVNNKIEAANLFTASLDTGSEVAAYQGSGAAAQGVDFLSGITADEDTIPTQAEVDAAIAAIVDSPAGEGSTFTLTDAVGESVVGSGANDTFTAVVNANGTDGTLQVGDQVNGGAGTDTLNIFATTGVTAAELVPTGAQISNVEIININNVAVTGTIDADDFGTAAEQVWQIGSVTDIQDLGAGQTAGFRNVTVANTVTFEDGAASGNIQLDSVGRNSDIDVLGEDLETLTVSGSVSSAGGTGRPGLVINVGNASDESIETLNLNLSSNVSLRIEGDSNGIPDELVTLNASGSTGGITLDASDATVFGQDSLALESVSFGSGADIIGANLASLSAAEASLDLGAGNDTLNLSVANSASGDTVTAFSVNLGAGDDRLVLTSQDGNLGAGVDSQADLMEGLVTVAGFSTSGDDALDLLAFSGGRTLQADVNAALSGSDAENLYEAALAVAGVVDTGDFALFEFGGNTYVYADDASADTDLSGDLLVELTGVSLSGLNAGDNLAV